METLLITYYSLLITYYSSETKIYYYRLKPLLYIVYDFILRGKYYFCCLFPVPCSLPRQRLITHLF